MGSYEWRYWLTIEGRVTTDRDSEDDAQQAALVDAESRLPVIEVEREGDDGGP